MTKMENEKILNPCHTTRNLLLRLFSAIYFVAFLSFYYQSEALFSNDGILPAKIEEIKGKTIEAQFLSLVSRPNLIRITKLFGLGTFASIEVISLLGTAIALLGFLFQSFCVMPMFITLWTCYMSLVDITRDFHSQADDLLLEAGLVVILLAPAICPKKSGISDNVMLILLRWVLFRFIFASGAVKLASSCPHWWNLSAIKHHLETMPLPTNMAFYAFYLPVGFLKLTTVFVNLSELLCPWLFFAPVRSLRIFSFYWQLFLQIFIIVTGNYGFLNFLVFTMLLSLLDDNHFKSSPNTGTSLKKIISFILTVAAIFSIFIVTMTFYQIKYENSDIDAKILFKKKEFQDLLRQMVKLSPFVATISIINVFLQSCIWHPNMSSAKGFVEKVSKIIHLLALTLLAIALVGCSTVPHGNLHPQTNISGTAIGKAYDDLLLKNHVVHEYGKHLSKMRSERLEIAFQYTHSADKVDAEWKDYDVVYRPINDNRTLPYMGPFFSRFDFKFHEAIGGGAKLEKNLWLASLTKQLLRNNRAVLLMFSKTNLYKVNVPPTYVRAVFMRLNYIPKKSAAPNSGLWKRKILSEDYLPPMSLTSVELIDLVKKLKISSVKEKVNYPKLQSILTSLRVYTEGIDGHLLVCGFMLASMMILLRKK